MDSLIPTLITVVFFAGLITAIIMDKKASYSFTCLAMASYTWVVRSIISHAPPSGKIFVGTSDPRILLFISVILLVFAFLMFLPLGKAQAIPSRMSGHPGWFFLLFGSAVQIGGFIAAMALFYYYRHLGFAIEMTESCVYAYLGCLAIASLLFYTSSRLGTAEFPNFFRKTIHILQFLFFIPLTLCPSICLIFAMPGFPYTSYPFLAQVSLFGFMAHGLLLLAMRKNHVFVIPLDDEAPEDFELTGFDEQRFTLE